MKPFNPHDWKPKKSEVPKQYERPARQRNNSYVSRDVDIVMSRINTDIAPTYADWLALGFALASEFGEGGRAYYHHLSSYYANYNSDETDKQYTNCLRSRSSGVTIKTFFQLAKNAGVNINTKTDEQ